jgi:hypothetical protein
LAVIDPFVPCVLVHAPDEIRFEVDSFNRRVITQETPTNPTESISWLAKRGVGEWARHDLSLWYPGWTVLVVAARGLDPVEAARFGFERRLIELS